MEVPTREAFFAACNGAPWLYARCLFEDYSYDAFVGAVLEAHKAALQRKPYYYDHSAGVANATTARCGCYVIPKSREVVIVYDRVKVSGRSVKCIYNGGERSYLAAWKETDPFKAAVVQACADTCQATTV